MLRDGVAAGLARFSTSSLMIVVWPKHVGAIFCVYFNVNFKPFQA
jgi:hypothetical protein